MLNNLQESLTNGLESSNAEERIVYLRAFQSLKSKTAIPILLKVIQTGTSREGVFAWRAIRSMELENWTDDVVKAAYKTFYQLGKKHDSSSRTIALDVILESKPNDDNLKEILYFLISNDSAFEIKQYTLQMLIMMSDKCEKFRAQLFRIIKSDRFLNNYSALAQRGLSIALNRPFLEHPSSNGSLLTIQEMHSGIVKRGVVNIIMSKNEYAQEIFSVSEIVVIIVKIYLLSCSWVFSRVA